MDVWTSFWCTVRCSNYKEASLSTKRATSQSTFTSYSEVSCIWQSSSPRRTSSQTASKKIISSDSANVPWIETIIQQVCSSRQKSFKSTQMYTKISLRRANWLFRLKKLNTWCALSHILETRIRSASKNWKSSRCTLWKKSTQKDIMSCHKEARNSTFTSFSEESAGYFYQRGCHRWLLYFLWAFKSEMSGSYLTLFIKASALEKSRP